MNPSLMLRYSLLGLMTVGLTIALILRQYDSSIDSEQPIVISHAAPTSENVLSNSEDEDFPADELDEPVAAPAKVSAQERAPPSTTALSPPKKETAREEVAANSHQSPKSLIQFANQIADRFDEVERSPDQADHFLTELEDCIRDNSQKLLSARALCLTNAEDLAAMFPQLKNRFLQIKSSAPQEVVDLSRATMGIDPGGPSMSY